MSGRKIKAEQSKATAARQQQQSSDDEGAASDSPKARKRARKDVKPVVRDSDAEDDDDDQDQQNDQEEQEQLDQDQLLQGSRLVRDDTGYVAGSIVRVACQAFVTYNNVEFFPGPALNCILGPNGTGKSTIACAIAIGLGFPPKVLGRSTKLSAFVKNGATDATWIEIELKGRPGKKNLVVKRNLFKDSEKSEFFLDGNEATAKEVAQKMEELDVQINNLCTFLPQDRVASFSMMSQSELLRETEKAAGDRRLNQWHQVLIEEFKKLKNFQDNHERLATALKKREDKQAIAEKEVEQYETRKRIEGELAVLSILIQFASYNHAFQEYQDSKTHRDNVKKEVAALEEANKPFQQSQQALQYVISQYEKQKSDGDRKAGKLEKEIKEYKRALESADTDTDKIRKSLGEVQSREKDRLRTIKGLQSEVAKLQDLCSDDKEPARPDFSQFQSQLAEITRQKSEISSCLPPNQAESNVAKQELSSLQADERAVHHRLAQLNSVTTQRDNNCKQFDPSTWFGVQWMRDNKQRFKGVVYEPARFNVFVPDQRNIQVIENPISLSAFSTFLFELREDYDTMMAEVNDKEHYVTIQNKQKKVKVAGAMFRPGQTRDSVGRLFTPDQLNQLGFDGFPTDYLTGPEDVLAWLASEHNLSKTPIQTRLRPIHQPGLDKLGVVTRYYTPEASFNLKRSNYGAKNLQTEQRSLKPAKILTGGLDQSKVDEQQQRLVQIAATREELKTKMAAIFAANTEMHDRIEALEQDRKDIDAQKVKLGEPLKKWQKSRAVLNSKQTSLEKELNKPSGEAQRTKLQEQLTKLCDKRVRQTLEHKDAVTRATRVSIAQASLQLRHLQAESDFRAMKSSALDKDRELNEKKSELEEVSSRTTLQYADAKQKSKAAEGSFEAAEEDVCEKVKARRDTEVLVVDQIQEEYDTAEAQLNVTAKVSGEVVRQFQANKTEILAYKERIKNSEQELNESKAKVDKTRALWLPRLEAVVNNISEKFSAAFDTLGLLGEVRLAKDEEDYDKWGIEILVSFRDGEPLKVLTSHRQSGGERALTTVMYLMSLADLAKAPFALVDEINQGMDQRVERNVHNALVKTTCKDDVGQYFLLTPKLLPDLHYHPRMKVLVIQAGTWIPGKLSLEDVIKAKLAKKKRGGH